MLYWPLYRGKQNEKTRILHKDNKYASNIVSEKYVENILDNDCQ